MTVIDPYFDGSMAHRSLDEASMEKKSEVDDVTWVMTSRLKPACDWPMAGELKRGGHQAPEALELAQLATPCAAALAFGGLFGVSTPPVSRQQVAGQVGGGVAAAPTTGRGSPRVRGPAPTPRGGSPDHSLPGPAPSRPSRPPAI